MIDKKTFIILLLNHARQILKQLDYYQRYESAKEIAEMTANISEIRAYNVSMRKDSKEWIDTDLIMDVFSHDIQEMNTNYDTNPAYQLYPHYSQKDTPKPT